MKFEALKKENETLKKETEKSQSALQKKYDLCKHHFKIKDLKHKALKRTLILRDSEIKDLKEKISKLSEASTNNNKEIEHRNSGDDEDDDVEVLQYVNKREKEKGKLVATN